MGATYRAAGAEDLRRAPIPTATFFRSGVPLPGPHAVLAGPTFEEWLDATPVAATPA